LCCPALLPACGNHSGEAEHLSGIGLKLFGFIPEPVFTFIPESCSRSSRNTVRNHPGIAFTLLRIPHPSELRGQSGMSTSMIRHFLPTSVDPPTSTRIGVNAIPPAVSQDKDRIELVGQDRAHSTGRHT